MIKIERGPVPASVLVLTKTDVVVNGQLVTRAERERGKAVAFYAAQAAVPPAPGGKRKGFNFTIYKDRELAQALEATFGTKCAYCESLFGAVMPGDVEHFRPKSEITTSTGVLVPGYFWLAATWDNLLLSCIHCNRRREHEVAGEVQRAVLGKASQFPLSDEVHRVRAPAGDIAAENAVRLLIDPCAEDPLDHLQFDDRGFVLPRPGGGGPDPKGAMTISVLALQRADLVKARLAVLIRFTSRVNELRTNLKDANALVGVPALADVYNNRLAAIENLKRLLAEMLLPGAPYVGMLRDWIRRKKQIGALADLEAGGIDLSLLI